MLKFGNTFVNVGGTYLTGYTSYTPPPSDEVTIGSAIWKNVDLAVDDGGSGIFIKNDVTVNGVNFGTKYYYSLEAAQRIANSIEGWHLPTTADTQYLWDQVYYSAPFSDDNYGLKTRSSAGWTDNKNGNGLFDFRSEPVGYLSGVKNYSAMNIASAGVANLFWINSSAWHYEELDLGSVRCYSSLDYYTLTNKWRSNYVDNTLGSESRDVMTISWYKSSPNSKSTAYYPAACTVRLVKDA